MINMITLHILKSIVNIRSIVKLISLYSKWLYSIFVKVFNFVICQMLCNNIMQGCQRSIQNKDDCKYISAYKSLISYIDIGCIYSIMIYRKYYLKANKGNLCLSRLRLKSICCTITQQMSRRYRCCYVHGLFYICSKIAAIHTFVAVGQSTGFLILSFWYTYQILLKSKIFMRLFQRSWIFIYSLFIYKSFQYYILLLSCIVQTI